MYAQRLGAPYAIATNGYSVLLVAMDRGSVRTRGEFPTLAELRAGLPPEPEPAPVAPPPLQPRRKEPSAAWWFLAPLAVPFALGAIIGVLQAVWTSVAWLLDNPEARPRIGLLLGIWAGTAGIIRWRTKIHWGLAVLAAIPTLLLVVSLLFIVGGLIFFAYAFTHPTCCTGL